jgi:hypothetical protein
MFRRFASAAAVASCAIAVAVLVVILTGALTVPKAYPLTTLWCFAPLVWGIWAALAPSRWVPQRFPIWGAVLGLGAGLFAGLVLNVPRLLFGVSLSVAWRALGATGMIVVYYLLWMLVRAAYRSLGGATSAS